MFVGLDACVIVYSWRMCPKMPVVRVLVLPVTMWVGSVFGDETMPAGGSAYISRVGG